MKNTLRFLLLLGGLLLAGCQASPAQPPVSSMPTVVPLAISVKAAGAASIEQAAIPKQQAAVDPTPAVSQDAAAEASAAAEQFAAALQSGDFESAAGRLSKFSLMVDGKTASEAADALKARMNGVIWSDFEVKDTRPIDSKTSLVHVSYAEETKNLETGQLTQAEIDALWPVRLENGQWRCNYANLIDYRTLETPEQTTGGLTVKPRRIVRYADRIRLVLLVQNQTNDPIVVGQTNEILAKFTFGEQQVEAVQTRFIFDHLRTYPDVAIEVMGTFDQYPDAVLIRQWKDYQVEPWFDFTLNR